MTATECKNRNIKILEMRNNGITLRMIGDAFGISKQRVQQIIGPTRVPGENKTEKISTRCTPVIKKGVESFAKDNGVSVSAAISTLLVRALYPTHMSIGAIFDNALGYVGLKNIEKRDCELRSEMKSIQDNK